MNKLRHSGFGIFSPPSCIPRKRWFFYVFGPSGIGPGGGSGWDSRADGCRGHDLEASLTSTHPGGVLEGLEESWKAWKASWPMVVKDACSLMMEKSILLVLIKGCAEKDETWT